jgi:hypothetical protein
MDYNNAILAAIDGTESWEYPNSHVRNFHDNFVSPNKNWWHGPNLSGYGTTTIRNEALDWIKRKMDSVGSSVPICLVGHSRGGMIAIDIADKLQNHGTKAYFLGLYDAVDWHFGIGWDVYVRNSMNTFHALRHPDMESRNFFGNTGILQIGGKFTPAYFRTSHGGVGGSPFPNEVSKSSDLSCLVSFEQIERCDEESDKAGYFIIEGARKCHLPI